MPVSFGHEPMNKLFRWMALLAVCCLSAAPTLVAAAEGDDHPGDRRLNIQNKTKEEKAKSKKKKQAEKKADYEEVDPYAGRIDIGFGGGYIYSNAGGGGEFGVSVTYHFNHWVKIVVSPGFGTYPIYYEAPDGDDEVAWVKYVPLDLDLIFTPYRGRVFTFYAGPGVGYHYAWWTEKARDPDHPKETIDEDHDQGTFSGSLTAGIAVGFGHGFGTSVGVTYTVPDLSDFNLDDALISFGVGGGVSF